MNKNSTQVVQEKRMLFAVEDKMTVISRLGPISKHRAKPKAILHQILGIDLSTGPRADLHPAVVSRRTTRL